MSTHTLPTDSIQRRHFEQRAATVGLGPIPEDSIQRRHYLQLLDDRLAAPKPAAASTPVGAATATAKKPSPAPQPRQEAAREQASRPGASAPAATAQDSRGWFGRLMDKLFGT